MKQMKKKVLVHLCKRVVDVVVGQKCPLRLLWQAKKGQRHVIAVFIQYGNSLDSCLVFWSDNVRYCNNFWKQSATRTNQEVRCWRSKEKQRDIEQGCWGLVRMVGVAENGTTLKLSQMEVQIVVKRGQCPKVADGVQIHQTTLCKSDRQAQRATDDFSRFSAKCGKGFGSPVTEVDWYSLVGKTAEAPTVKELRSIGWCLKKVNLGA